MKWSISVVKLRQICEYLFAQCVCIFENCWKYILYSMSKIIWNQKSVTWRTSRMWFEPQSPLEQVDTTAAHNLNLQNTFQNDFYMSCVTTGHHTHTHMQIHVQLSSSSTLSVYLHLIEESLVLCLKHNGKNHLARAAAKKIKLFFCQV